MSKFILFTDGVLSARYDSAINTEIPESAIEVSDALFFQTINDTDGIWSLIDGDVVKKPIIIEPETHEQIIARLDNAIERHIQSVINELGYVSIERLSIYANSTNAKWKAEALGAPLWITAVWEKAIDVMNAVKDGNRDVPTEAELIALMPKLENYIQYE